ncbi:MAG: hypothetical protein WCO79_02440 [bacterium]
MQDTNKNAIWIFVVIIVVLGLIWATNSKPKTSTSMKTASTTPMVSNETAINMTDLNPAKTPGAVGSGVKSPTLPAAGIGPKN